jgi:hypothetical protein
VPASALVLDGGSKPKARKPRRADISEAQKDRFFVTLAETCNVTRAAKAAGFCTDWAYRRRKRDAAFRNAWLAAVREGYAKLELVLLERRKGSRRGSRAAARPSLLPAEHGKPDRSAPPGSPWAGTRSSARAWPRSPIRRAAR